MGVRLHLLKTSAEQALLTGQIHCLLTMVFKNERPQYGLTGSLDWYFNGAISEFLKSGAIKGNHNEITYLPLLRGENLFHLILIGAGDSSRPGERPTVELKDLASQLSWNLNSLKFSKVGLSRSDFGNVGNSFLERYLGGVSLWIAP